MSFAEFIAVAVVANLCAISISQAQSASQPAVIGNCSGNSVRGNHNSQTNDCSIHIEQIPNPTWHIIHANPEVKNSDGTFSRTFLIETMSQIPQNNVAFLVRGKTVVDIELNGVGPGAAIRFAKGKTSDGWYLDSFTMPTVGQWNLGAKTTDADTPFDMNVVFNANIH